MIPFTLKSIWKNRNHNSFDKKKDKPSFPLTHAEAIDYTLLIKRSSTTAFTNDIFVCWSPLPSNHYKLNTDGFYLGKTEKGGIGGLIHNTMGGWVLSFTKSFQWATNNQMGILALREGIKLVKERNLLQVEINIDSTEVISILYAGNLHYDSIIYDCRLRLKRIEIPPVVHYFREQDGVGDALAIKGIILEVELGTKIFKVPPMCAQHMLWADISGTHFIRRISLTPNSTEGNALKAFVMNPD